VLQVRVNNDSRSDGYGLSCIFGIRKSAAIRVRSGHSSPSDAPVHCPPKSTLPGRHRSVLCIDSYLLCSTIMPSSFGNQSLAYVGLQLAWAEIAVQIVDILQTSGGRNTCVSQWLCAQHTAAVSISAGVMLSPVLKISRFASSAPLPAIFSLETFLNRTRRSLFSIFHFTRVSWTFSFFVTTFS
jgi:hypothetical protein